MIRDWVLRVFPVGLVRTVLSPYWAVRHIWRVHRARFKPFAKVFPEAKQFNVSPPSKVDTPEIGTMRLFYGAAHLRSKTYWTPRDFVACVEGAMFCPYNGVILSRSGDIVQESFNIGIAGLDLTRLRDKEVVPLSGTYALLRSRVAQLLSHNCR